jgi:hypothetical protein
MLQKQRLINMSSGICRDCGKEAVVDQTRGLGPICLKKYGMQPNLKKNRAAPAIKITKKDLSTIKNTFDVHGDVEEAPLDLTLHYALQEAGYDDFNREDAERIFDVAIKTLFNGDRIPAEFKDKLNAMGFEVKGYLPRMKCAPGNFTNLIVGTKNSKMDMMLRVNANYDTGLIFFRTNPQYTLLNSTQDDLFISLRDEVSGDSSESAADFNYFMAKISKDPHVEYIDNFPDWVLENCNSNNAAEKTNFFSIANVTASKRRGNERMKVHKKQLSLSQLKSSAFMSPEEDSISPLRMNIIKYVAEKHQNLSDVKVLFQAVEEVDIHTYDVYNTKMGRIFGHTSSKPALWKTVSDVEVPIPESADNNALTRKISTAVFLCKEKGYSQAKTQKVILEYYHMYIPEK